MMRLSFIKEEAWVSLRNRLRHKGRLASNDGAAAADVLLTNVGEADQAAEDSAARLRESLDFLEVDVTRLIGDVLVAASAAHHDIGAVAAATLAVTIGSQALAAAAEDAARDVSRLAAASLDLTASGKEITNRLRDVAALSASAKLKTFDARSSADGLKASSAEIGPIVGLISAIARKTNF